MNKNEVANRTESKDIRSWGLENGSGPEIPQNFPPSRCSETFVSTPPWVSIDPHTAFKSYKQIEKGKPSIKFSQRDWSVLMKDFAERYEKARGIFMRPGRFSWFTVPSFKWVTKKLTVYTK